MTILTISNINESCRNFLDAPPLFQSAEYFLLPLTVSGLKVHITLDIFALEPVIVHAKETPPEIVIFHQNSSYFLSSSVSVSLVVNFDPSRFIHCSGFLATNRFLWPNNLPVFHCQGHIN